MGSENLASPEMTGHASSVLTELREPGLELFRQERSSLAIASELGIAASNINRWHRRERIDADDIPGTDSTVAVELVYATKEVFATKLAVSMLTNDGSRPQGASRSTSSGRAEHPLPTSPNPAPVPSK